ncbi:MAG: DMT family transporter [Pseudomonadota bacterium]
MNQSILIAAAFATGALVPLQLVFNAQLGGVTRNAFTASFIVFAVGLIVLTAIIGITRPSLPGLSELTAAPKTVWLGGLIATFYILAIVVITPQLGVGLTTALILVGQLCMALALDHFGAFGNPQQSLGLTRALGLAMMIAGVVTIKAF